MGDGLKIGGKTYPVQIIAKDSQSTGTRAWSRSVPAAMTQH